MLMIFLLFSIILIVIGITQATYKCPPNKVIYRYIPRTLDEEINSPVSTSEIYKKMFEYDSPWVKATKNIDSDININDNNSSYYISQY